MGIALYARQLPETPIIGVAMVRWNRSVGGRDVFGTVQIDGRAVCADELDAILIYRVGRGS